LGNPSVHDLQTPAVTTQDPPTPLNSIPEICIAHSDSELETLTRHGTIAAKRNVDEQRSLVFAELGRLKPSPEKTRLYSAVQDCKSRSAELEEHLLKRFIPQHSPHQFLAPRAFFVSPLFHVRSIACVRDDPVRIELPTSAGRPRIQYVGPELRQSDGLVFLSLIQMLRDVEIGTAVNFSPEALNRALLSRYDGHTRRQLREAIERLQRGSVVYEKFGARLCASFDSPKFGPWTVALDEKILEVFRTSPAVWLHMAHRRNLPDGLPSWLYCYIESQTKLIPMTLASLMRLCGSNAGHKAFTNRMRAALSILSNLGIIDTGWSIKKGYVRWMNARATAANDTMPVSPAGEPSAHGG